MLVEDLQLALAHDKTFVVATSKPLATIVAHHREVPTSGVASTAPHLGIDVGAGKRGGTLAPVRMSRLLKAKRRMGRIARFCNSLRM